MPLDRTVTRLLFEMKPESLEPRTCVFEGVHAPCGAACRQYGPDHGPVLGLRLRAACVIACLRAHVFRLSALFVVVVVVVV